MPLTKPTYDVDNIQGLETLVEDQEAELKILFDKTGADTKTYLIALCDQLDLDFATKLELADAILGEFPDGSILDTKLSNTAGQIKDRVQDLETSLASVTQFAYGSYTGDGTANRVITVGFNPVIVEVMAVNPGVSLYITSDAGRTITENAFQVSLSSPITGVQLTSNGFQTGNASLYYGNESGKKYYWTAKK